MLPGASKYLIDDVVKHKDFDMLYVVLIWVVAAITVQAVTSFLLTRLLQRRSPTPDRQTSGVKVQQKVIEFAHQLL